MDGYSKARNTFSNCGIEKGKHYPIKRDDQFYIVTGPKGTITILIKDWVTESKPVSNKQKFW